MGDENEEVLRDSDGNPIIKDSPVGKPLVGPRDHSIVVNRDREKVQAAMKGEASQVNFMMMSVDQHFQVEMRTDIKPIHSGSELTGERYTQATFGGAAVPSDYVVIGVEISCKNLTEIQFEAEVWDTVLLSGMSQRPLVIVNEDGIITHCNHTGAEALQMVGREDKVVGQAL